MTTGRTGSDYLQACLDNVNGLMTFCGKFEYHNFLKENKKLNNEELIEKFILINKKAFSYDKIEDIDTRVDTEKLKKNFIDITKNKTITSKNFLVSLYEAYYCISQKNLKNAKALIHHSHGIENTRNCLKDYPDAKLFITIRDPRANLKSGLFNWFKFDRSRIHMSHIYSYIRRIREDLKYAISLKNEKFFLKLEEAGEIKIKKEICDFLNINYDRTIETATFNSKIWHGDILSLKKSNKGEYNESVKLNDWQKYFKSDELLFFNKIYSDYKKFGYDLPKLSMFEKVKLITLIFKKFSFEKETFSINLSFKKKISNYYYFIKRILYGLKLALIF